MSGLYLGVDAGNSKTAALVARDDGTIIGWGRGGVGDIYSELGAEVAADNVLSAIAAALAEAGVAMTDIDHTAFRLAGLDWTSDDEHWRDVLRRRLPECRSFSLKNDGYAMLNFASPTGRGVAATAGTAAAVAARGPAGQEYTASFWLQRSMGGIGLGFDAYQAVVEAELGIAPATSLRESMLGLYGCVSVAALIEQFTRRVEPSARLDYRHAAKAVMDHARGGDAVAQRIVTQQAEAFVLYIGAVAERVGFDVARDEVAIVLAGSIFMSENTVMRDCVEARAARALPRARIIESTAQPVQGAALDALVEGGVAATDAVRARVEAGGYPAGYLDTQHAGTPARGVDDTAGRPAG